MKMLPNQQHCHMISRTTIRPKPRRWFRPRKPFTIGEIIGIILIIVLFLVINFSIYEFPIEQYKESIKKRGGISL